MRFRTTCGTRFLKWKIAKKCCLKMPSCTVRHRESCFLLHDTLFASPDVWMCTLWIPSIYLWAPPPLLDYLMWYLKQSGLLKRMIAYILNATRLKKVCKEKWGSEVSHFILCKCFSKAHTYCFVLELLCDRQGILPQFPYLLSFKTLAPRLERDW